MLTRTRRNIAGRAPQQAHGRRRIEELPAAERVVEAVPRSAPGLGPGVRAGRTRHRRGAARARRRGTGARARTREHPPPVEHRRRRAPSGRPSRAISPTRCRAPPPRQPAPAEPRPPRTTSRRGDGSPPATPAPKPVAESGRGPTEALRPHAASRDAAGDVRASAQAAEEKRAETVKPVAEKPVVEKPVVEKPVAEKPVAGKPVVEKPVAEEPVAPKPKTKPATTPETPVAREATTASGVTEIDHTLGRARDLDSAFAALPIATAAEQRTEAIVPDGDDDERGRAPDRHQA